ncbi:2-keto-3-deoxygluconate kinase [Arboricoccus pini]|uniref:2-keto-3-deoxygluconate kinase n=1 Tax=Arboricoccus pini TaxID=1963835 RepID=A0A212PZQ7_9PROT|nr:sugar kinase [Arboricoccus pini]SNB52469.1 2-keto-3-deoxygluconate kinase [Arboricoccus pini]
MSLNANGAGPDSVEADLDLVAIGEPMVEFNQRDPASPSFLMGHGGDTSNCAIAAARAGARVGYLTRLGWDMFGDQFVELWRREGVDCSAVGRDEKAPTGIYFVTHGPDGHAFTYYRRHSAASLMSPEWLPMGYIHRARLLYVSGISFAISESACDTMLAAIDTARLAGREIALDTNLRLGLWSLPRARAILAEAARMANILRPSIDDARLLTGLENPDAIADHYLRLGARIVALTLGSAGALIATGQHRVRLEPHAVACVDATGAGDTFGGAFLAAHLRGADPFTAGRFANAAAALATRDFGAVAPMPRRREIEAYLDGQP